MSEIKRNFSEAAGEDVTYLRSNIRGRDLEIVYVVAGDLKNERTLNVRLLNGASTEVESKARFLGAEAARIAFRATGKYDAQLKRLSEGKLAP